MSMTILELGECGELSGCWKELIGDDNGNYS